MLNAKHEVIAPQSALMLWDDLWPAGAHSAASGWAEQLRPGLSVLVDATGDEAAQWLAVLSGQALPGQGRVACAGLCSRADNAAYQAQVYRHNPRLPAYGYETLAQQWLQAVAQRWPTWSDAAWQQHCAGFALAAHMDKPLSHLSTGCLRKLGLAAALASGAPLTVIEEPTGALDSPAIRYLCQALDALGQALAEQPQAPRWVMVSHWEPLAGVTCDEVLAPPALPPRGTLAAASQAPVVGST